MTLQPWQVLNLDLSLSLISDCNYRLAPLSSLQTLKKKVEYAGHHSSINLLALHLSFQKDLKSEGFGPHPDPSTNRRAAILKCPCTYWGMSDVTVSFLFLLSGGEPSPSPGSKDFHSLPAQQVAFLIASKKLFNGNAIPAHELRIFRKSPPTFRLHTLDRVQGVGVQMACEVNYEH